MGMILTFAGPSQDTMELLEEDSHQCKAYAHLGPLNTPYHTPLNNAPIPFKESRLCSSGLRVCSDRLHIAPTTAM